MALPLSKMDSFAKADVRSSVEIENSCNDCCSCWGRRIKPIHKRAERQNERVNININDVKVKEDGN